MVSKPDTGQYASEEAEPRRGWTRGSVPTRTMGPKMGGLGGPTLIGEGNECQRRRWPRRGRGWIVRSHIGWGGERAFFIRVWKSLPSRCVLKTLRGNPKGKAQRGQYLLAVGSGRYSFSLLNLLSLLHGKG